MKLNIDPEIDALFGELEPQIRTLLKKDIKERKVRVKGVVADPPFEGTIVQGHTRYLICQELKIEFPYEIRHYETREELMKDAVQDNLLRRHLSIVQRADLARRYLLPIETKKAKERMKKGREIGGKITSKTAVIKNLNTAVSKEKKGSALEKAAKDVGVSSTTLFQVNKVMEKGDNKLKQRMLKGEISIKGAYQNATKPKPQYNPELDWKDTRVEGDCIKCGKKLWVLHNISTGKHKVVDAEKRRRKSFGSVKVTDEEMENMMGKNK